MGMNAAWSVPGARAVVQAVSRRGACVGGLLSGTVKPQLPQTLTLLF